MSDSLRRFNFADKDVRGCIVQLTESIAAIQQTHHYPDALAELLNQFAASAVLLRDSLKIDASVTIQLRTQGAIRVLMADCQADFQLRAICDYDAQALPSVATMALNELSSDAVLAITITPEKGERYQGIVAIEKPSLAACLQDYFLRSEQLPSAFHLSADADCATGIVLHSLPQQYSANVEQQQADFQHVQTLLNSLRPDEALELTQQSILTRLFHQDECRLLEPKAVTFGCPCSAQKSLDILRSLGKQELDQLLSERQAEGFNTVQMDCHFCFQQYTFDFDELSALFDS